MFVIISFVLNSGGIGRDGATGGSKVDASSGQTTSNPLTKQSSGIGALGASHRRRATSQAKSTPCAHRRQKLDVPGW